MSSGFRAVLDGEWTKVKALGLAIAVQLVLLPLVFATGLAHPAELPLPLLAALAGGLLFGMSMRWAGGCAAGVWYKLGAGDVGALLAILGMALGAAAAEAGPLAGLGVALRQPMADAASWAPPAFASVAAGLVLAASLSRLAPGRAGAWDWRRTGLVVGLAAAVAWPASALVGRPFGLAVVPGTAGVVSGVAGGGFPAWDVVLVLGILLGGWLAARGNGRVPLRAPGPAALLKRLAGGLGLGAGASIAGGCTVGQGLTGLGLLAPSGFVVMVAIFAGSAATTLATRRLEGLSWRPATFADSRQARRS